MDQAATQLSFRLAADAMLILHACFVAFVIFGLILTLIGGARGWAWVRNPWFRWAHLLAIAVVVLQAWLGVVCPLTTWEMALRNQAGDVTYGGAFVAHWVESLLYYRAPPWVFVVLYTGFGLIVLASWIGIRPRRFRGD